jgi:hypothetical protein
MSIEAAGAAAALNSHTTPAVIASRAPRLPVFIRLGARLTLHEHDAHRLLYHGDAAVARANCIAAT